MPIYHMVICQKCGAKHSLLNTPLKNIILVSCIKCSNEFVIIGQKDK